MSMGATGAVVRKRKGQWIHSDEYCPDKPTTGLHQGRHWECSCGRIWKVTEIGHSVLGDSYGLREWQLVQGKPLGEQFEYVGDRGEGSHWFWSPEAETSP